MYQKKRYSKPDIEIVDFLLSSSIATNCKFDPVHADGTSCPGYRDNDNGWVFFTVGTGSPCNFPGDIEGNPEFCYHVPSDDSRIFDS